MKTIVYILVQCTWGAAQTFLGFFLFLWNLKAPHEIFHGAVHTRWRRNSGISLGLFIFTPDKEEEWCYRMAVHEYGHTYQSLLLGPLYLLLIGLPSAVWANASVCKEMRARKGLDYSAFYTEKWADDLGRKMTAA